ncbi:MAG: DMT family transporter [Candidatus Bathyarchaeota archaeon]|nr:MAG: DMT family transporter [Candidatus Bathyarchaeota archaeon]
MDWFVFALIAPILWAGTDVIDKYILANHIKNPFSYQLLTALTTAPLPFLLFLLTPISYSFPWSLLTMLAAFVLFSSFVLYFKAMAVEEASRVISFVYVGPIFVLPLAFIFLGESLSLSKYLGAMLLVSSAVLISYRRTEGKKSFVISPALGFMLTFTLVHAGYEVLAKYILNSINYWHFLFWWSIGGLLGGFLFLYFPKVRRDFLSDFRTLSKNVVFWKSICTCLFFVGVFSYYVAVSLEPISLVATIPSTEPFFVLLFTVLLSSLMPGMLKEEVDKRTITMKISAVILIIIGAWLIAG